ncbi:MAG: 2-oxoacid:acceptor oxidoreductase family protein [Candidatus Lokiarchaeota archaeon]|nr:2-oxoacid:acceptor oxidoreductase family protein [Candidatus Lokiarchaeota archaeon]
MNDAHLVLGLEPLETLRNIKFISEKTVVILNTHENVPRSVILKSNQDVEYPKIAKIIEYMDQFARRVVSMDFHEFSKARLNHSVFQNSMILGVATKEFKEIFNKELMINVLNYFLKNSEENVKAFEIGYDLINT